MFEPQGSLEEKIDILEKDIEKLKDYIRRLRESMQEESAERIADFENLEIDTMTVSDWTIQTSFKPSTDATVDLGAVGATDYRFRHLYLSGNLSDETNSLTVANALSAYTHVSANGTSHGYIDQSVVNGANVTFGTLESGELTVNSGEPCSVILKGTSSGIDNRCWIGFYDSSGTPRRGYVGDASNQNTDIVLAADGTGDVKIKSTGGNVIMLSDDTLALTLDTSQNATFVGTVTATDTFFKGPVVDARAYGMATGASAANNRTYLQAAIDGAPVGGTVIIPRSAGAYLIDNAIPLEITGALTLIFYGEVELVRHDSDFCNVTGDDVTIIGEGGQIVGNGIFVQNGAIACAMFHVTGDRFTCRDLTLEDPVQCAIWLEGSNDVVISGVRIIGGTTLGAGSGTQNYGIEIKDTCTGIMISNVAIVPNGAGGVCVQGITGGSAANKGWISINGCYFEVCHDHGIYLMGDYNSFTGNTFNSVVGGSIKFVGKQVTVTGNTIKCGSGAGIIAGNCDQAVITGNKIDDYNSIGIEVYEYGTYEGNYDNIIIANNSIRGKSSGTVKAGINVNTSDRSADNLQIVNNIIQDADSAGTYHGIYVATDGTDTVDRVKIDGNIIDNCGGIGIAVLRISEGSICNNLIRNPGVQTASDGIKIAQNCDNIKIANNQITDEKDTPNMPYGINVVASASNTNIFVEFNKIAGAQAADVLITSTEGKVIVMTSAGYVGINRPAPNSGAFLEVGGNIAAGYSDTGKIALHNAAGAERGYLQVDSATLHIYSDSNLYIRPNNTLSATFLAAGQLELVNDLWMANNRPLRFRNAADNDNLICMNLDDSDILNIAGDATVTTVNIVASTKIGDKTTNYAQFAANGDLTLVGTARVLKEIEVIAMSFAPGLSGATITLLGNYSGYAYTIDDDMIAEFELPHDWASGTDLSVLLYWYCDEDYATRSGEVQWKIDWSACPVDETETVDVPTHTGSIDYNDQDIPANANELTRTAGGTIAAVSLASGDVIGMKISRIDIDGGTEPVAEPVIIRAEIEYISDRLGEPTT